MRYQDYVIKDGKFIGKFEEMYQECDNPWHQIELTEAMYSKAATVNTIKRFKLQNILEIGCGLGYFTNRLSKECVDTAVTGMDVSETAIKKAKAQWPGLSFFCGNVKDIDSILETHEKHKPIDGILFSEILWYVLDNLDEIKEKLNRWMSAREGTVLIVNQIFYNGQQKYGREFFTNQDEMIRYFGWDVLVRARTDIADMPDAYETHTVFSI